MYQIPPTTHYKQFINNQWVDASDGARIERFSPGHGDQLISTYPKGTEADAERAIAAARKAFDTGKWASTGGADRAAILLKTSQLIRDNAKALGLIECLESGKPISQAENEMQWAAGIWDYAAALCRTLSGETTNTLGDGLFGMTLREPAGVVSMITPWNFPLLIVSQKLPFALAAGCCCVVKPSEFTSGTTLKLGELLQEAGLPEGVVNIVTGYGEPVGRVLSEHPDVDHVSFTGSTGVGKKIVSASAQTLKKVSLELGGKNPQIVFADAEIEAAADAIAFGIFFNMGECCNSGSRILVHDSIADQLVEGVLAKTKNTRVGDPLDPTVQVGAIINEAQHEKILSYIEAGKACGAKVVTGGNVLKIGEGRFIEPTLFDHVPSSASIAREEIFGPVLTIIRFTDTEEALRIANDSLYGLSASVWTRDFNTAMTCTRKIRAGTVWINTFMDGAPELPFGGYKESGLGRELGPHSVEEFTEMKTVTMRLGSYESKWA